MNKFLETQITDKLTQEAENMNRIITKRLAYW